MNLTLKQALDALIENHQTRDGLVTIGIKIQAVRTIYGISYAKYFEVEDGCLRFNGKDLATAFNQAIEGKHDPETIFDYQTINESELDDFDQLGHIIKLELKAA